MAKISLRSYLQEIGDLIDKGHTEEAAAHCHYILQSYPKCLAAYRLLGKAYLESQRLGDAADIFQRVLSSTPDDFISHVGMSVVREDEGNVDAAIWHMERAFEVQPYNGAIQGELRRLYGRRDGVEPPKVRLTRGALARMYARGHLYQQAIGELRAALAEDPQRPDLQVLLARMYFMAGMKVESVETCSNLIKKLPFCLEANRILSIILPETGRKEDSDIYKQHVMALDPYLVHASPQAPSSDGVPENIVSLDKYDYKIGGPNVQESTQGQPAWAASLGVSFDTSSQREALPEWLSAEEESPKPRSQSPFVSEESIPAEAELPWTAPAPREAQTPAWPTAEEKPAEEKAIPSEENIPDWMKQAGWGPSTGAAQEGSVSFEAGGEETQPEGEIVPGEVPDWLKAMAPPKVEEIKATPELPVEEPAKAELPEWLTGIGPQAAGPETPPSESAGPAQTTPVPAEPGGTPDWLQEMNEKAVTPEEPAAPAGEIPEWLKGLGEETAPEAEAKVGIEISPEEPAAEAPAWPEEPGGEILPEPPAAEVGPVPEAVPSDEGAALAWLEGLAAKQGAPEDELITRPEERAEVPPTWVQEAAAEAGQPEGEPPAEKAEIPDWLSEIGAPAAETQIPVEEIPTAEVAARAAVEEPAVEAEIPEWLKEIGAPAAGAEAQKMEIPSAEVETPAAEEAPALEAEVPDWLKEMRAPAVPEQAVSAESFSMEAAEVPVEEPAIEAEIPDWLKEMGVEPAKAETPEIEMPRAGIPEEILPAETHATPAELEIAPAEELPAAAVPVESVPAEAVPAAPVTAAKPDLSDEAAALAWLESLAAKQGVPEGELITRPEERLETPPAWVQEAAQEAEPEPPAQPIPLQTLAEEKAAEGELPVWLKEIETETPEGIIPEGVVPEEKAPESGAPEIPAAEAQAPGAVEPEARLPEIEIPAETVETVPAAIEAVPQEGYGVPTFDSEEAAMAWLESLAARQGVPEEELMTRPEERPSEPPAWVKEVVEETPAAVAEVPPEAVPAEEAIPIEPVAEEIELPEWLQTAAPTEAVEELPELPTVEEAMAPGPEPELPGWLQEVAEEKEEVFEQPAGPLVDINQAGLAELENLPGVGFIMAQKIIAHRETSGPFTSIDDLTQVPGFDPALLADIQNRLTVTTVAVPEKAKPVVEVPQPVQVGVEQDKFIQAQTALAQGNPAESVQIYETLIKDECRLEDVIHDLKGATAQFPAEMAVWQALGDAYMRNDQLQDAIDAYTKAEQLLG